MEKAIYKKDNIILEIISSNEKIIAINFIKSDLNEKKTNDTSKVIQDCIKQLDEYFNCTRTSFDIPLQIDGTEYQKKVWNTLLEIPYGSTCSYKDVAQKINNPKGCRAVGNANNKNKIPIIIPCHRVLMSDGKIGGYAGGIEIKRYLLSIESKMKI